MSESKTIVVMRAGGMASQEVEIVAGETAEQLCVLVAPHLGLPDHGAYRLLSSDGRQITGDLYKQVRDHDKVTLAQVGEGGAPTTSCRARRRDAEGSRG